MSKNPTTQLSPSPAATGGAGKSNAQPLTLAVAPDTLTDDQIIAGLVPAYKKAVGGLMDVLIFGAMMLQAEKVVFTRENNSRGPQTKGGGLKGLLESRAKNDINYNTAYRFMRLAEGLQKEFQLGTKVDMVKLLSAPLEQLPPNLKKTREKIEKFVEGKSQRQLQFDFGNREIEDKGGKKIKKSAPLTPEEEEAAARLEAGHFFKDLHRSLFDLAAKPEQLHYAPVLSENIVEEMDLQHLETALATALQHVRDELTTRGGKPTTKAK